MHKPLAKKKLQKKRNPLKKLFTKNKQPLKKSTLK